MRQQIPAATQAKNLLNHASRHLNTTSPAAVQDLSEILDASMYLPLGHPSYGDKGPRLEPHFSETAADSLSFIMDTGGPGGTPADRIETSTRAMSRLVGNHFGREALNWFRSRSEPVTGDGAARASNWGAWFGTGLDRHGVMEAMATYEWGPGLMDSLPSSLYKIARAAVEALPGLRPAFSSIRCGRSSGSQQITFEVDAALPLINLQALMTNLGLGQHHASLMSACALILGARFTLPPSTSTITLRPTRKGVEMRLDVILDALPDTPSQLMSLLRLQMSERPKSLRALDRWLMALTPDGYPGPGDFSVLSVWVRPDMPARVALYLRPSALEHAADQPDMDRDDVSQTVIPYGDIASSSAWSEWEPSRR